MVNGKPQPSTTSAAFGGDRAVERLPQAAGPAVAPDPVMGSSPVILPRARRRAHPAPSSEAAAMPPTVGRAREPDGADRAHAPRAAQALKSDPESPSFSQATLDAYLRGDNVGSVLRVAPPSQWALLGSLCLVIVAAIALATFGHIELTSRGPGVLWRPEGVQLVSSAIGGSVAQVHVRSGDSVHRGDLLVSVDAAEMTAALLQAERAHAAARDAMDEFEGPKRAAYEETVQLLEQRAALLQQRVHSQKGSLKRARHRARLFDGLHENGLVSVIEADARNGALESDERSTLGLKDELVQNRLQLQELKHNHHAEGVRVAQALRDAEVEVDAAKLVLQQATIRATRDGQVEALLVKPGELLRPGSPVARLVPIEAPSSVIAFLPERDRAFLQVGEVVRLELKQLPVGEFGTAPARIARISSALATPDEVAQYLGAPPEGGGPYVQVELSVDRSRAWPAQFGALRVGALLTARFPLRKRRIIALAFEPLRRWLE